MTCLSPPPPFMNCELYSGGPDRLTFEGSPSELEIEAKMPTPRPNRAMPPHSCCYRHKMDNHLLPVAARSLFGFRCFPCVSCAFLPGTLPLSSHSASAAAPWSRSRRAAASPRHRLRRWRRPRAPRRPRRPRAGAEEQHALFVGRGARRAKGERLDDPGHGDIVRLDDARSLSST